MTRTSHARLLLVGAGHAHLEVVRRLAGRRELGATLLNAGPHAVYSGMLPGLIAGHYRPEQIQIDLPRLCRRSGVGFESTVVREVRPDRSEVVCADGAVWSFEVLSIDTGAAPNLADVPGAHAHAVAVKPIEQFLTRWQQFLASASDCPPATRHVVVVGGGPGGVELVLAMRHRSVARAGATACIPHFTLLSEELLAGHARSVQRRLRAVLRDREIELVSGRVARVDDGQLATADGLRLPADFLVFATGAAAPTWLADSGLARDQSGFVAVDASLRSCSHPQVFAAGDVATPIARPVPKSGVYAVRAGPILFENLCAVLEQRRPHAELAASRHTLALLTSGEQHATLSYGPLALSGRWLWKVKDSIDRRFMERYA